MKPRLSRLVTVMCLVAALAAIPQVTLGRTPDDPLGYPYSARLVEADTHYRLLVAVGAANDVVEFRKSKTDHTAPVSFFANNVEYFLSPEFLDHYQKGVLLTEDAATIETAGLTLNHPHWFFEDFSRKLLLSDVKLDLEYLAISTYSTIEIEMDKYCADQRNAATASYIGLEASVGGMAVSCPFFFTGVGGIGCGLSTIGALASLYGTVTTSGNVNEFCSGIDGGENPPPPPPDTCPDGSQPDDHGYCPGWCPDGFPPTIYGCPGYTCPDGSTPGINGICESEFPL